MSLNQDHSPATPEVKQTAIDYLKPHNHRPVPLALDYAKADYFRQREYGIARLALAHGATRTEIARVLGISRSLITRLFKTIGGGSNGY